jgi:C1A family cysteine protease
LSEQWTYWNAKKIDPWGPSVEGTSTRYALKVLQKLGCPPEEAWKYTDNKIDIGKPESWSHMVARWNTIESYWRLNSVEDMESALRNIGPVVVGIGCYEEIFRPEPDGFIPYPAQPQYCYGGHAVLICGYDLDSHRFLFKNSWGANWGQDGYGWLGFDYMRDFCWDAWVTQDHRVTRGMLKGTVTL